MILETLGSPANRMAFLFGLLGVWALLCLWVVLIHWRGRLRTTAKASGYASLAFLALGLWHSEASSPCMLLAGILIVATLIIGKAPRGLAWFGWIVAAWLIYVPVESAVEITYRHKRPLPESTARQIADKALRRYASQYSLPPETYRLTEASPPKDGVRMFTFRTGVNGGDEVHFVVDAYGNAEREGGR